MKKKSQSAIEFVTLLAFVLFFFVIFFTVIRSDEIDKNKEKELVIVQNLALDVQDEINLAVESSDGYQRNFTTPLKILGRDYEIEIVKGGLNYLVYIKSPNAGISYKVANVTGNIQKGQNTIKKEGGEVYLNSP